MSSPARVWSASTTECASRNCSRNRTSSSAVSSGRPHRPWSYQRGRGHEPVTVAGSIRSLVAVNIRVRLLVVSSGSRNTVPRSPRVDTSTPNYAPELLNNVVGPIEDWEPIVEDEALLDLLQHGCRLERLAGGAAWSEGPGGWPQTDRLLWSDIPNDRVLTWHAITGVETYLAPAEFQNGHALDVDGS